MSDAVAALKTTDYLLAQLDNLSRLEEFSSKLGPTKFGEFGQWLKGV